MKTSPEGFSPRRVAPAHRRVRRGEEETGQAGITDNELKDITLLIIGGCNEMDYSFYTIFHTY